MENQCLWINEGSVRSSESDKNRDIHFPSSGKYEKEREEEKCEWHWKELEITDELSSVN